MKYTSALVTAASGSLKGITASHNKGGAYLRGRVTPTNPNSAQQIAVRAALSQLAQAWNTDLSAVQRTAWNLYASNVSRVNSLGAAVHLSGLQEYIRSNASRLQAGVARVDDAPTQFDSGQLTVPAAGLIDTLTAPNVLKIGFANTDPWAIAAGGYLLVYASAAQNPGISFFKGPFRFVGKVTGAATPPTSPATIPTTLLLPIVAAKTTFVQVRASAPDGRLTEAVIASKSAS